MKKMKRIAAVMVAMLMMTGLLPVLLSRSDLDHFLADLAAAGWEYREEQDWILLRKSADDPPKEWFTGSFGPEAACCGSLLKRHTGLPQDAPEAAQRMLIKAGEEGEKAYEAVCASLHRDWAGRLRQGKPLPALSLKYFGFKEEVGLK